MSEPITSLKCPSCGALVPLFERKPQVTCGVCGAEFPVRYVEPASVVDFEAPPAKSIAVEAFVLWLLTRWKK